MMDMRQTSGNKDGNPGGQQPGGYKSKLDEILAKAGNNNPIARAQAKAAGQPSAAPAAPAAPVAPAAQPAQVTQQAAPQAQATTGTQDPNDRLQQILAMAGKTPAQQAQYKAQQANAANAANVAAILQAYIQAVSTDPRKVLRLEIDFANAGGSPEEIYFRCYADASGNVFWDIFGEDISYVIPASISSYALYDNYFKGVPDATVRTELITSRITANAVA